jgi:uncharacterized NAD(P)/FAD-binding protein YdhS
MSAPLDVAFVGAGLCASRVVVGLAALGAGAATTRPRELGIALFDKAGAFGRGIPYGLRSERRGLLIEDLAGTRCPEFTDWLAANPAALESLGEAPDADDRAWFARNREAIRAREFAGLFIPRHVFGSFSAQTLEASLARAADTRLFTTQRLREDICRLERGSHDDFLLTAASGARWRARRVVLAPGSIPRRDQFFPAPDAATARSYFSDSEFCGSFALGASLDAYATHVPRGPLRLAIIGAAASAIESLYTALTHPAIGPRLTRVVTLSPSGMLPGGLRDPSQPEAPVSPWAKLRGSARDYVEAARTALAAGLLGIVPARISGVDRVGAAYEVRYQHPASGARATFAADLVVNCSGAGSLASTAAPLLAQLASLLPVRADGRGFVMQEDGCVHGWPGLHVVGPLLNEANIDTHVESISAAFRAGERVAGQLFAALELTRAACAR